MECDGDMNRGALIKSIAEKSGRNAEEADAALDPGVQAKKRFY